MTLEPGHNLHSLCCLREGVGSAFRKIETGSESEEPTLAEGRYRNWMLKAEGGRTSSRRPGSLGTVAEDSLLEQEVTASAEEGNSAAGPDLQELPEEGEDVIAGLSMREPRFIRILNDGDLRGG